MDNPDKTFSELFGIVKSWMPWRSEPANVSKDFWMPDHSCRVCYECDSQFTIFNRRHHCRLCGRVFCAKCTENSIPAPSQEPRTTHEEWEKIRVCNYCFRQWQQGTATLDNGVQVFSPSPSASSLLSTKSSGTANSSSVTLGPGPYLAEPYQSAQNRSCMSPRQSEIMDPVIDKQGRLSSSTRSGDPVGDIRVPSPKQFEFCMNRSDDEDDEYSMYRSDSEPRHFSHVNDFYCHDEFDEINNSYGSDKANNDGEKFDPKSLSSSPLLGGSFDSQNLEGELPNGKREHEVSYECEAPSSIYVEGVDAEPVDFENNGLLWLPPEPEDEEDEREATLFDDEDDDVGDGRGEWGYLQASSSFGSGEYRNRDRSSDEHKKVMKSVVDGHFRALVAQLLEVENLPVGEEGDKESWLEIITSLSWEAALLLKPDMSKGGDMDPGGYVKVKCIAHGRRCESMVVKGVVCKKNVAHRRMTSKIEKPRFLILGGALEYQRVSNQLSSFDTLLQQEMDHLKMAVAKIDAHHPDVLLVEKSVSRFAQDYLLAKDISLVLNIKRPLLERVARCTGAQIVPSIDHLSSQKLGYCEMFHVEKFMEEHGSAGQAGKKLIKTLMFFDGCPRPFGCTILLKGANGDELKKVKHVVQYGIFAAYHLALETSFLADEGATLPDLPLKSPITVALPNKPSSIDRSISTIPGFTLPSNEKSQYAKPTSDFVNSIASLSISSSGQVVSDSNGNNNLSPSDDMSKEYMETKFSVVNNGQTMVPQSHSSKMVEESVPLKEEFPPSPSDHQSILVSLSTRCVWKGTVCERAHLFRFKYYGSSDKPLGRFLRDHLFEQSYRCRSCEMPSEAHVHCYTHRQGTLTISVKKLPEFLLPGERDGKIWMWHRCLRCPRTNGFPPATRRVVMSDAAWGLSFGKFLELSFSNHAAASRVASCGHSLHRDCLRFYGFGKMVACFRYASIDVYSVYLPPPKIDFKCENQEWIETETKEVVGRAELLFSEVLNTLRQIEKNGSRRRIGELEFILKKEKAEFEESLDKTLNREARKGEPCVDILEINRLRRQLLFQSYMWDQRLIFAASLDNNSISISEKKEKNITHNEKPVETRMPSEPGKSFSSFDSFLAHDQAMLEQGSNPKREDEAKMPDQLGLLESGMSVRRALSEGQFPIMANLSDTLDAAWTGENSPLHDSADTGAALEKLNLESTYTKPIDNYNNVEDSVSWLGMSFINFYRAFNKNFLGSAQKLDNLSEYSPVYISSFRDLELQGGARMLLPVGVNDTVVPVYDDEPTSSIAYALVSTDYHIQLSSDLERPKEGGDSTFSLQFSDSGHLSSFHSFDESTVSDSFRSLGSTDEGFSSVSGSRSSLVLDPLFYTKSSHVKVSFSDDSPHGKVKYTVTCYYAKRFDALRRLCCPSELDYVRSLSRCKKWGAQGGKSNVFFAKTLDDRFIIKQVTKTELESFIKFAPGYFKSLSESIGTGSPTCLAKILGIYQVTAKHLKGGKETRMDVLVMENLLFRRNVTRLYDLKGSSRSRYNPDSSGTNKVLLDQNLIEAMPTSPIFVGNKAKRLLERAVWNDTSFLASIDVMDYSLLVGVDEEKHELVLGIIDFMRQYTWDKHLETWVKASGILGGPKNASPTVISPKQYKKRFRKAMSTYFLMVPDQWSPLTIVPSKSQSDLGEEHTQEGASVE